MADNGMKAIWHKTNVIISTYVSGKHKRLAFTYCIVQFDTFRSVNDVLSIQKELVRNFHFS